ncbi:putative aldehyde dehydrogenase [metagenome]|uniref:Putative aldehyde dehydrogenase n=1 Tax=metagenome TaxID=256318 RepID=A0A2P2C296_9ZZZZ
MEQLDNFVDGHWVRATGEEQWTVLDPATARPIAHAGVSTARDVDAAVRAAQAALPAWRGMPPAERARRLGQLTSLVAAAANDLIAREVRDTGKPLAVYRDDEFPVTLDAMAFFAGSGRYLSAPAAGELIAGRTSFSRREPVGVVAAITPWNFPLLQAVLKVVPALATGNTVVLKPAESTPLTSSRFVELAAEVLPPGVLNLVLGPGSTGAALVAHPGVALVSFTGSVAAGKAIARSAADQVKRLVLELGGNAPAVVFDDVDPEPVVDSLVETALGNAGQDCTASSRWIVHESVLDEVTERAVALVSSWRVGAPDDEATQLGPLISAGQRDRVEALLAGLPPSAEALVAATRPDLPGYYLSPSVIVGLGQQDDLVRQEVFGPVITLQSFATDEEALNLANDTTYGLAGSVWTRDLGRGMSFASQMDFGSVWVNDHTLFSPEIPQGGFGESGYGKENGLAGAEEFTRLKSVSVNLH